MIKRNESHSVQIGADAARVLESAAYKEAMAGMRAQIIDQWKACPVRDREGQFLLLQLAKVADKFENLLSGMVEAGKLAQRRIDLDSLRDEGPVRQFMRKVVHG